MISILTLYAMQYLGRPYKWGANGPFQFDCSALVLRVLRDAKIINDDVDRTAQSIYILLSKRYFSFKNPSENCILFFGESTTKITHVGIAINNELMIHAGGGGRAVQSIDDAKKHDAFVKIQNINYRQDLVACIQVINEKVLL